jgi:hypothetical protein
MSKYSVLVFIFALGLIVPALAEQYQVAPELIDTVDLTEHRRTWGAPDGGFFILKKNGIEQRRYPELAVRSLSSRGNQKLISAERGHYYAFLGYANFSPTDLKIQTMTLYNAVGGEVWSVKNPGCNSFILCDGAPIAVGVSGAEGLAESRLQFYGDTGELRGSTRVENFYAGQWCPDGQWFFAITGAGQLVKFSPAGVEAAKIGPASRYFTSRDGSCVAAQTDTLLVFALPAVTFAMPMRPEILRSVHFAADGSRAAILTRDQLEILDLTNRTTLGKLSVANTPFQLFHFDSDPNFNFFVCGANNSADSPDRRNTVGKVMLLNASAAPLWERTFDYEDWSIRFPDVRLSSELRTFSVLTMHDLYVYRY